MTIWQLIEEDNIRYPFEQYKKEKKNIKNAQFNQ
jgi:hypothetical protein